MVMFRDIKCNAVNNYNIIFSVIIRTTLQQEPVEVILIEKTGKLFQDFEVIFSSTVRTKLTVLSLD